MKHMKKKFLRSLTDVKSWNKKKSLLVCNNGTFLFLLQIGGHMSKEGGGGVKWAIFLVYLFVYFLVRTKVPSIFTFLKILHYQGHKFCSREEFQVHTDVV